MAQWLGTPGCFPNETGIFLIAYEPGNGPAGLFEAGEIPQVRKVAALLRLDRLNGAFVAFKKDAGAVRIFRQREAEAILCQPREALDEGDFAHFEKRREPCDFAVLESHFARPPAAGGAALAFMKHRHDRTMQFPQMNAKAQRWN